VKSKTTTKHNNFRFVAHQINDKREREREIYLDIQDRKRNHKMKYLLVIIYFSLNSLVWARASLQEDVEGKQHAYNKQNDETEIIAYQQLPLWPPATSTNPSIQDLHKEYYNIFKYGNRNAASHRWSTFLLDRSNQTSFERLEFFFTGFCAVSGSPVRPNDYNRYRLTLSHVAGGYVTGFMHFCCWPCVCDTQDYIRIDTKTITFQDGKQQKLYFTVIGNPCDDPEQLHKPFYQPFYGGSTATIAQTAKEVRCLDGGIMEGATLSDHGYIIISMFFDAMEVNEPSPSLLSSELDAPPAPGRISSVDINGKTILFQDEREWENHCTDRARNGYNSGMGEIFRQVCSISPIPTTPLLNKSNNQVISADGPSCESNTTGAAIE
jgi:hypothetical protein